MEDLALGRAFRRVRVRLGWRQADLAHVAGVSISTCSLIERGQIDGLTLATLRKVGKPLEIEVQFVLRWRGGELFRMLAAGHSAMAERVTRQMAAAGWDTRPEVSFSHFGERGVVDLVAWHGERKAILLVELKTELVDIGDLLATMDRRRRLAGVIAGSLGWTPNLVGSWVVLTDTRTNRRRLADHSALLRSAFPSDGRSVAGWIANPDRPASALWFLPNSDEARSGTRPGPVRRVTEPKSDLGRPVDPAA
jgi:transcriptional regulator with XRE-family HTH domain